MHYDDVENFDSWGFLTNGELYDVMSKWDPQDLTEYEGWMISQVKFIVTNSLPYLSVKIWEGPDAVEIYSQEVPEFNVNEWTIVDLDSAIFFDHTKELYFGYQVDMTHILNGGFVTATDDGPPVDGYGNLVRKNGAWLSEYNNHNLRAMICEPIIADFMADRTTVCDSATVSFTNLSNAAESYSWAFPGGTPFSSALENPTVIYHTPGTYNVTLTITHGGQTSTEVKEEYIKVLEIPAQIEGESLVCEYTEENYSVLYNLGSNYTWNVVNGEIIDGQGTNEVTIAWQDPGTGYVSVLEETIYECQGQSGFFEVTVDVCTGLEEGQPEKSLVVFPNPVHGDELTIKQLKNEAVAVYITDLSGRIISQMELTANQATIKMEDLPQGLYILKAIFNNRVETIKIIKD
jgi:PKD repeat protein